MHYKANGARYQESSQSLNKKSCSVRFGEFVILKCSLVLKNCIPKLARHRSHPESKIHETL
ncbi:hypothetical protein TSUD_244830 [Trifolium subterraneum]|uniref:Uncharacterized protein n=1 Tax=Trifolium subterraneum TaxID=3900 RepID=A0A2Z6N9I7_TRISU|nr:hypothetical protein TSUD_244830 [Trifolium subterraneum]